MKLQTVLKMIRDKCDKLGGQMAYAREAGVTKQAVSMVLNGKRLPTDDILAAINVRRKPMEYERIPTAERNRARRKQV